MLRFTVVLLALAALTYSEERAQIKPADRIVGGTPAEISNVPWMLSLRQWNEHLCGATLISTTWAVSAAHCTDGQSVSSFSLLAGTANRLSGGQTRAVAQVIQHPGLTSKLDNDISLLRVSSGFSLGTNVRPASLPDQGAAVPTGTYGIVSGWGSLSEESNTAPTALQQVWVPVVSHASCLTAYGGGITDNMLCAGYWAGGSDAYQGDSGSPYVSNGQLIGIVSSGKGCALPDYPGIYTRVSAYRNWIRTNTGV